MYCAIQWHTQTGIPFVYYPHAFWKMVAYQHVTPLKSPRTQNIPFLSSTEFRKDFCRNRERESLTTTRNRYFEHIIGKYWPFSWRVPIICFFLVNSRKQWEQQKTEQTPISFSKVTESLRVPVRIEGSSGEMFIISAGFISRYYLVNNGKQSKQNAFLSSSDNNRILMFCSCFHIDIFLSMMLNVWKRWLN